MKWIFFVVDYNDWYRKFCNNLMSTLIVFAVICFVPFITCNSTDPLDEAVAEYTNTTGVKIYPYGKECLRKEGEKRGFKYKSEYLMLIRENEKYMK